MPAYPFNPSTIHWTPPPPHQRGSFRPTGPLLFHGHRPNPTVWSSKRSLVGRIIVGFNVGHTPTYTTKDLREIVERVRESQTGDPSSTFVDQSGIYKHRDNTGIVHEDGAQVFIVNMSSTDDEFQAEMIELAETIAREMQQEVVILEIQENGVSQGIWGVGP